MSFMRLSKGLAAGIILTKKLQTESRKDQTCFTFHNHESVRVLLGLSDVITSSDGEHEALSRQYTSSMHGALRRTSKNYKKNDYLAVVSLAGCVHSRV